jgi:hypothetical protein
MDSNEEMLAQPKQINDVNGQSQNQGVSGSGSVNEGASESANESELKYADAQRPEEYWLPKWIIIAIICLLSLAAIILLILLYNLFFQEGIEYQAKNYIFNKSQGT